MSRLRLLFLAVVGVVLFGGVAARLVYLQVIDHDRLAARVKRQQEEQITIDAPRGRILDRHGVVIAESAEAVGVYANPREVAAKGATARRLAPVLNRPVRRIARCLNRRGSFVWLARRLPATVQTAVESLHLPGIHCIREPGRYYPLGETFRSVAGLVGVDGQELEGLEVAYDDLLRGEPGLYLRRRDGNNQAVEIRLLRAARPGANLHLTLDEVVQHIAHTALADGIEANGARGGVAVVLDPRNGELLAMVDSGAPGSTGRRADAGRPYRSNVVTWTYEPGSIFKPLVAAALLEEGRAVPDTLVYGEGGSYRVADRIFHDAAGDHFGWLSFAQVLQRSSNIGMIKLTADLPSTTLYERLRAWGIGKRTGIDYPGEPIGTFRPPKRWSGVSRASVSIGQELRVTALQIAAFYGALANGGTLYPPHLTHDDVAARTVRPLPSPRRILSEKTCRTLVRILEGVTTPKGTAPKAAVEGFSVAGKTGTAQQWDTRHHCYSRTRFVSSFVGMVPAKRPRIVCIVSLDGARGRAYGGQVAAPIFREIATRTLRYLGIQPGDGPRLLQVAAADRPPRLAELSQ